MIKFPLKYGQDRLELSFSQGQVKVIENLGKEVIEDQEIEQAFCRALDNSGEKSLDQVVCKEDSILLIVPDKTRNYRIHKFLPFFLERLLHLGVRKRDITFIFAGGTHTTMNREQMAAILGEEIYDQYNSCQHDCDDMDRMVYLGVHDSVEIYINDIVNKFDKIITINGVNPHHFFGFSGGPKTIMPGIAARKSINQNHQMVLHPTKERLNKKATLGLLAGNPIYDNSLKVMNLVGPHFAINPVLNDKGNFMRFFCGDPYSSHIEACNFVENNFFIPIAKKGDLVIVSPGGHPKDLTLMQSYKALTSASLAAKKGGTIIFTANCREGLGSDISYKWLKVEKRSEYFTLMKKNYQTEARSIFFTRQLAEEFDIMLFSQLPKAVTSSLGLKQLTGKKEVQNAIDQKLKSDSLVYIIPHGNLVYPKPATVH